MSEASLDAFAPTFKVVGGVIDLPTAEYNRLLEKYGSTWNWCQAFGLRLVNAEHLAERMTRVFVVDNMPEAHAPEGVAPAGDADPVDPPAEVDPWPLPVARPKRKAHS